MEVNGIDILKVLLQISKYELVVILPCACKADTEASSKESRIINIEIL